jgi:spore coat protein A
MSSTDRPEIPRRRALLQALAGLAVPAAVPLPGVAAVTGNAAVTSWASLSDPTTYAQAFAARFTQALPNPLDGVGANGVNAFYRTDPIGPVRFNIQIHQVRQDVLGVPGKATTVWGYKNWETAQATYPGRSFEVRRNVPTLVSWQNNLRTPAGPLPHILPVDQSITIQTPTTGVPVVVHHHGGDTAPEFDGGPDQWHTPVRRQVGPGIGDAATDPYAPATLYQYTNAQEASLHWYHDHAEGLTRINVHAGLAGLYVVRDGNEDYLTYLANTIPRPPYEVGLVLQDRCFDAVGNLVYAADPADYPAPASLPSNQPTHMPEMFGDVIVVNGKAWPNLRVEPRPYRLRLLNGSDSRFYTLSFGAAAVYQIGTDLGLLNRGVPLRTVTIAPGERVDLVVDFGTAPGASIVVGNSAATPFPGGVAPTGGATVVMRIQVNLPLNAAVPRTAANLLPQLPLRVLAETPPLPSASARLAAMSPAPTVRRVLLGEGTDQYGRITPLLGVYRPNNPGANRGTLSFADPATERPTVGSTEVWEFWNVSPDAHPVHMHLVQFQVIDRRSFSAPPPQATTMSNGWTGVRLVGPTSWTAAAVPAPAHEAGWKDTVVCPPGQVTRVLVTFNRRGRYVYHCHILSHEEHDMMRWYEVI